MALPWVRLDANVGTHDKILGLIADPSPKKWQALSSYFIALAWSGGQGTDGKVPSYALQSVQGTTATARLLVKYDLWLEGTACWLIKNFDQRQELDVVAEAKRSARILSARKAACIRHHGADCHCWKVAVDA